MAAATQAGVVARLAFINGAPGWVSVRDDQVYAMGAVTVQNGRITAMDILLDAARLARLNVLGTHSGGNSASARAV